MRNQVLANMDKNERAKRKQDPLDRHYFIEKIQNDYTSLKNHEETATRFYQEHIKDAYKKMRRKTENLDRNKVGVGPSNLVMVPIEDGNI